MGNANIPLVLDPVGLDFFFGIDNTGIDIIATNASQPPLSGSSAALCPQPVAIAHTPAPQNTAFPPVHIDIQQGTFNPINFFVSPDASRVYIVTTDSGVLVYSFDTQSVSAIPLLGDATPVAADMTVDGTLLYVAGSDGMLHVLNTITATDQEPSIFFSELPNSSNNFCYSSFTCALNLVAVQP
jgi:hypothetical protein